jgi:hypothetical protein
MSTWGEGGGGGGGGAGEGEGAAVAGPCVPRAADRAAGGPAPHQPHQASAAARQQQPDSQAGSSQCSSRAHLAEVVGHLLGDLRHGVALVAGVALVGAHLRGGRASAARSGAGSLPAAGCVVLTNKHHHCWRSAAADCTLVLGHPAAAPCPASRTARWHNTIIGAIIISASGTHVLGHVLRGIEHGVHGVDVLEVHQRAVGQLPGRVELALAEGVLEDVERGHLRGRGGGGRRRAGRPAARRLRAGRPAGGGGGRKAGSLAGGCCRQPPEAAIAGQGGRTAAPGRATHPHAQGDLGAGLGQRLGDGPAEALCAAAAAAPAVRFWWVGARRRQGACTAVTQLRAGADADAPDTHLIIGDAGNEGLLACAARWQGAAASAPGGSPQETGRRRLRVAIVPRSSCFRWCWRAGAARGCCRG